MGAARPVVWAAALLLLLNGSDAARAGEDSVTLGTSGPQIMTAAVIVHETEELYVSAHEVRARYRFVNRSLQPVTSPVFFTLPDIDHAQLSDGEVSLPNAATANFVDLVVKVDGVPVTAELDQRALLGGQDVSAALRDLGVALLPYPDVSSLRALGAEDRTRLQARGLAMFYEQYEPVEVQPQWVTRTRLSWWQTFPVGQPVTIEQSYKPVVRRSSLSMLSLKGFEPYLGYECIDAGMRSALDRRLAGEDTRAQPALLETEEVQHAWIAAGIRPVGAFHLTIDKGQPDTILLTCMEGLTETSPTTLELQRSDYRPPRDLAVLFVQHSPPPQCPCR
jgi:hypothetical protein